MRTVEVILDDDHVALAIPLKTLELAQSLAEQLDCTPIELISMAVEDATMRLASVQRYGSY